MNKTSCEVCGWIGGIARVCVGCVTLNAGTRMRVWGMPERTISKRSREMFCDSGDGWTMTQPLFWQRMNVMRAAINRS